VAVVAAAWPREQYGEVLAERGVRYEMFVYVADVDAAVESVAGHGPAGAGGHAVG